MPTRLRKLLPKPIRRMAAGWRYRWLEKVDALFGDADDLVPPRELNSVGDGDFQRVGDEFFGYFRDLAGLQPHHHVLDVGCGIGRMAVPLTRYLTADGGYEGFDVVPHGIAWCTRKITPKYPNFRFQCVPVRNSDYNPNGRITAAQFRFPYPDASFDLAILTSVFTHMLPDEVEHYVSEIARVLRPGGRSFTTWFLLNDESRALLAAGRASIDFRYPFDDCLTLSAEVPGQAIAYREERVLDMHARRGLAVEPPLRYGYWCERAEPLTFQDVCIARKAG